MLRGCSSSCWCGPSRRSTRSRRRSASRMMTWVYSASSSFGQFPGQQLRRAAHAAQRVLDLVRQAANDRPGGLLGVQQALLPADLQQAVHRLQLHQQAADLVAGHRGDDEVDMDFLAGVQGQRHAAARQGAPAGENLLQVCQPVPGSQYQLPGVQPQAARGGGFQQGLAGCVQAGDPQVGVQCQNPGADIVQNVLVLLPSLPHIRTPYCAP